MHNVVQANLNEAERLIKESASEHKQAQAYIASATVLNNSSDRKLNQAKEILSKIQDYMDIEKALFST